MNCKMATRVTLRLEMCPTLQQTAEVEIVSYSQSWQPCHKSITPPYSCPDSTVTKVIRAAASMARPLCQLSQILTPEKSSQREREGEREGMEMKSSENRIQRSREGQREGRPSHDGEAIVDRSLLTLTSFASSFIPLRTTLRASPFGDLVRRGSP